MPYKTRSIARATFLGVVGSCLLFAGEAFTAPVFDLPPVPPPDQYGNILIDRRATQKGVKPVSFSHWSHRLRFTCRVCHTELGFTMKVNTSEITEAENKAGKYCGACHNGRIAFSQKECGRCHNNDIAYGSEKFDLFMENPFPRTPYGDGINWVEALRVGMINPRTYLKTKSKDIVFEKTLTIESGWSIISPSIFPHRAHIQWLDCSTCHPDLFNIKLKSTKSFTMSNILKGDFCGVCHLTVAFPMNDCKRCHPGIAEERGGQ